MGRGREAREEGRSLAARALTYVGPATAAAIDEAPFDAANIRDRSVSYVDLLAAGINPGVAAKLRREYSLLWSFFWEPGADLSSRAEHVTGLEPEQREWIAASGSADDETDGIEREPIEAERAWRERSAWVGGSDDTTTCERCDEPLVSFQMGERSAVHCEGCGFVGVPVRT